MPRKYDNNLESPASDNSFAKEVPSEATMSRHGEEELRDLLLAMQESKSPCKLAEELKLFGYSDVAEVVRARDIHIQGFTDLTRETHRMKDIPQQTWHQIEFLQWALNDFVREQSRASLLFSQELMHPFKAISFTPGPCSSCNCWSRREVRMGGAAKLDLCLCRPMVRFDLEAPTLEVYRDKALVKMPHWTGKHADHRYGFLYASPEEVPYQLKVDAIDFRRVVDVDYNVIPYVEDIPLTPSDYCMRGCGFDYRKDLNKGNFFWVNPCRRLCGYSHSSRPRVEGEIILTADNGNYVKLYVPTVEGAENQKMHERVKFDEDSGIFSATWNCLKVFFEFSDPESAKVTQSKNAKLSHSDEKVKVLAAALQHRMKEAQANITRSAAQKFVDLAP